MQPSNDPKLPLEAVLISHKEAKKPRGTILVPHGGPHSCYPTSFFTGYAFLVTVGFNVLLVNFRGSTGFGEDSIQSLPGNIGTNDVLDCMACLQAAADTGQPGLRSHPSHARSAMQWRHISVQKCALLMLELAHQVC